jgi:hypothetical protein
MGIFRQRRVKRVGRARYAVHLQDWEQQLLNGLAGDLRGLLEEDTDDPSVRRLFPTAYHDDAEKDAEYQVLVRDELLQRRLAALDALQSTTPDRELDAAGLTAWMGAVNQMRLVIGTNLDVSDDVAAIEADAPDAPHWAVYDYLTGLLAEIVDALEGGLGDPDPEAPPPP